MTNSLRVLIVEEQPAIAEQMAFNLRETGFKINWIRTDSEADFLCQLGTPPDLILASYTSPGFSALDALRLLQERQLDVPFAVVPRASDTSLTRDIAERQRAEQALRRTNLFLKLLEGVAVAANEASSLETALQVAIEQICRLIGWPVGHAYLAQKGASRKLISTGIWYMQDPERYAVFRKITEAIDVAALDDLPGKVLLSGMPEWIADLSMAPSTPRFQLISNIGVRAGFAFPILIGAEVAAVLEFFASETIAPDEPLLIVMGHVGTQLGRVVERSRAEAALRASEERYRLLAENTGDVIMMADLAGQLVYVSPACRTVLGYEPATLLQTDAFALIHPDDHRSIMYSWRDSAATTVLQLTVRVRHANGDWRLFEVHGVRVEQHGVPYIITVSCDITERRRAELLEEERHQIAYELHDGLAQTVTSTHQHLQAFAARYRSRSPRTRAALDHVLDLARHSVQEVRRVIAGLRPTALEDFGLALALQLHIAALQSQGWQATYRETLGAERLATATEIAFFRIAQEALTNVRKHAATTQVDVALERTATTLRLSVRDYGQGFDSGALDNGVCPGEHIGLRGMRERTTLLGGRLHLESHAGQGTIIIAEAPIAI